jgi:uncharacterized protein DUF4421
VSGKIKNIFAWNWFKILILNDMAQNCKVVVSSLFFLQYLIGFSDARAQNDTISTDNNSELSEQHDTTYFKAYPYHFIGRVYLSQKFTRLSIENDTSGYSLEYLPNTSLNLGIGFTYKWATLNLAYGFGFLNPDEGEGETKYLDMQFHSYGTKLMLDVLAQFYRGFHLKSEDLKTGDGEFYQRPDLEVYEIGALVQYVFNNKKFSYRSSFMQNEWQKKSAGSFLLGAEAYIGNSRADSTTIPTEVDSNVAAKNYIDMRFIELGPSVGYAHTFVIKKHFFIHGSLSLGLTVGSTSYKGDDGTTKETGLSPNITTRLAFGYNTDQWVLNFLFTNSQVELNRAQSPQKVGLDTGNIRLIFAKRFSPGKKLQKKLDLIPTR